MATCNQTFSTVSLVDGTMEVVEKLRILTEESLGTNSIYMRAKDTFKELFDGKNITSDEYAQLASGFVSQLAVATTQTVMQGALEWAKQEKEMTYSLAALQAQADATLAGIERIRHEICKIDKENDLICANITATIAGSIRDNGRVKDRDTVNGCIPITLENEGTKYEQGLFIESQKYAALADAYRKSGIVKVGIDTDGTLKGLSANNMGYTDAQEEFARRQVLSFEDSKRNHAVNAMSQMIGQMLSSEVAPKVEDVTRWRSGVDYLLSNSAGMTDTSYILSLNTNLLLTDVLTLVPEASKDSTIELVNIASIVNRIMATASYSTVYPELTAADFATIAVTGVTSDNLPFLLSYISASSPIGEGVKSVELIQALVTQAEADYQDSL